MRKRILALVLSLVLIASALPGRVSAEGISGEMLKQRIEDHYLKALELHESETFNGYCGALASYQLYFLGINSYPIMANGNDQYDIYKDWGYTDNGYRVKLYPAEEYTLEEALNAITHGGLWNAYNILVGFQATTTEAGSQYGHAVVIYGIVDGRVYFTESYGTPYFEKEGMPGVCSISQFAAMYESWTTLEGVVYFGQKGYLDNCFRYNANMYVQTSQELPLYSMPDTLYTDAKSKLIRNTGAGEFLLATGLFKNPNGVCYYQVRDGETVCYVEAEETIPVRFNAEDLIVTDLEYPQVLETGKDFTLKGKISSHYSLVGSVTMTVTDESGKTILTHSRARRGGAYDLSTDTFNPMVNFGGLEEGVYTYTLTASVQSNYMDQGTLETGARETTICSVQFAVGAETELPEQAEIAPRAQEDGWAIREGVWCYYEQGEPRTGWICIDGLDYYLKEDGAPTVGWAEINGKNRYFYGSGAMCTGWLHTEEGTFYLLKNGQMAKGWRKIEQERYYFDENGNPVIGWQTIEEKTYFFFADGGMASEWENLQGENYYFAPDGQFLAKAIISGDTVTYELQVEQEVEIPPLFEEETE